MPSLQSLRARLLSLANPAQAAILERFFKTDAGEYGEGDRFLGIKVGPIRALVREYAELPLLAIDSLLASEIHEERRFALLLLVRRAAQAEKKNPQDLRAIYDFYLARTSRVNNWDLVDASAEHIVGAYLETRSRAPLDRLARSRSLWERRIAIVATHRYIKKGDPATTFHLAERLLSDPEDLIHKAVGWMLREAGQRGAAPALETFLATHADVMPRTMLRYAIERFPEVERKRWLSRGGRSAR